jgi:ribosomal protein L5
MKYLISKIIINSGLGARSPSEILKVKKHFQSVFSGYLLKAQEKLEFTITKIAKANAKFKIRKGQDAGTMVTLRRHKMKNFLKLLSTKIQNLEDLKYSHNTLSLGVSDHRTWKLERYNYLAPEYGFQVIICIERLGSRVKYRRIGPTKIKENLTKTQCLDILKQHIRNVQ